MEVEESGGTTIKVKPSWRDRVAAARAGLPADADFPQLVREGVAGPSRITPEVAAAFGKWLELDSDAALDFLGRSARDQPVPQLHGELARWLDDGNHHRKFAALRKRFPMAGEALLDSAKDLCESRGAAFLLEFVAGQVPAVEDRMALLCASLPLERWEGQLAAAVATLSPRQARVFITTLIDGRVDVILLDEIRAAGFSPDAVAQIEATAAEREWWRQRQQQAEPEEAAEPLSEAALRAQSEEALEGEIRSRATGEVDLDPFRSGLSFSDVWPDYPDKLADLRDGRCSAEDMLREMKAAWPGASKVESELRIAIFQEYFKDQPVEALRWFSAIGGGRWRDKVIPAMSYLRPEQMVRVVDEFPDLAETENSYPSTLFSRWYEEDPVACRAALLRFPNVELREYLLEEFDQKEERKKEGGAER